MSIRYYSRYNFSHDSKQPLGDLEVELLCFSSQLDWQGKLSRPQHFMNIAQMIWGPHNRTKHFIWHPWAEWYLEHACQQKYLAVLGSGNSGKTEFFSLWALINWLASPLNTKVLVTSTSLKESRKRIWGCIREYFMAAKGLPGKLIDSTGIIRTAGADESASDRCGIELIAGEKKKEKEAVGKLIGIKRDRVILIADEMPELSPALIGAAKSNLALNPYFQMVGIGNFASEFDSLGEFAKPKDRGYSDLRLDDCEWETEDGYCLRADGLKSPNITSGRDEYPFLYGNKDLQEHKRTLGETSALFYRMCRTFPCPEGSANVIFSEQDMRAGRVMDPPDWASTPIKLAAIDVAHTSDGDRTIAAFMSYGTEKSGLDVIALDEIVHVIEDIKKEEKSLNHQIAEKYVELCKARGIPPQNAAYDSTAGAGIIFGEILGRLWSKRCFGVQFGGKASELRVSLSDKRKACDAYTNKVTEVWYSGQEFCRAGQLRGITKSVAKELKSRKCSTTKSQGTVRAVAESKREMKMRTTFSPDEADAFLMGVILCKERLGAIAGIYLNAPAEEEAVHDDLVEATQSLESEPGYSDEPWEEVALL